jgi:putative DNA primase/helicase
MLTQFSTNILNTPIKPTNPINPAYPTDFNDLHALAGITKVNEIITHTINSPAFNISNALNICTALRAFNIEEFLSIDIPPRAMILDPIIPEQGLVMLYGKRGNGKTFCSIGIAVTVASGGHMLGHKWQADKPRKVLYVDGEMPATALQARMANIIAGYEFEIADPNNLQIITPDFQELGIADLATPEGQRVIEEHLAGVNLLILDNLSALCRTGKENESEAWIPMQRWLLSLRKRNISVLLVHHAGKNGGQRGNSKKEDLLDTVIALVRPHDYDPAEGARFEIHYDKARGFYGNNAKPFEVKIVQQEEQIIWQVSDIKDQQLDRVLELTLANYTQRQIADELQISAATVNRLLKKAKAKEEGKGEREA